MKRRGERRDGGGRGKGGGGRGKGGRPGGGAREPEPEPEPECEPSGGGDPAARGGGSRASRARWRRGSGWLSAAGRPPPAPYRPLPPPPLLPSPASRGGWRRESTVKSPSAAAGRRMGSGSSSYRPKAIYLDIDGRIQKVAPSPTQTPPPPPGEPCRGRARRGGTVRASAGSGCGLRALRQLCSGAGVPTRRLPGERGDSPGGWGGGLVFPFHRQSFSF